MNIKITPTNPPKKPLRDSVSVDIQEIGKWCRLKKEKYSPFGIWYTPKVCTKILKRACNHYTKLFVQATFTSGSKLEGYQKYALNLEEVYWIRRSIKVNLDKVSEKGGLQKKSHEKALNDLLGVYKKYSCELLCWLYKCSVEALNCGESVEHADKFMHDVLKEAPSLSFVYLDFYATLGCTKKFELKKRLEAVGCFMKHLESFREKRSRVLLASKHLSFLKKEIETHGKGMGRVSGIILFMTLLGKYHRELDFNLQNSYVSFLNTQCKEVAGKRLLKEVDSMIKECRLLRNWKENLWLDCLSLLKTCGNVLQYCFILVVKIFVFYIFLMLMAEGPMNRQLK